MTWARRRTWSQARWNCSAERWTVPRAPDHPHVVKHLLDLPCQVFAGPFTHDERDQDCRRTQTLVLNSNRGKSGRQDSNLRPLVPQTSPHFPMSAEFDLEWFRREMVGMTTRAGAMVSIGIPSTSPEVRWAYPPSSPLFSCLELGRIVTRPPRAPDHAAPSSLNTAI